MCDQTLLIELVEELIIGNNYVLI